MKYNLIEIILRGGPRDGQIIKLPRFTTSIDIPRIEQAHLAESVTPTAIKRHSWDDDALDVSYDRYCYMEELSTNEWPIFQFQCTHHTPGQDVV